MAFNCGSGSTSVVGQVEALQTRLNLKCDTTDGSTTGRTDTYAVPANKYWIVRAVAVQRANGGSLQIKFNIGGTDFSYYFDSTSLTAVTYTDLNVRLPAGDEVKITAGAGTSGNIITYVYYEEYNV